MSTLTKYYTKNHAENPYTMETCKNSSRVQFLMDYINQYAKPGENILDVGCGDMYLAKTLTKFNWTGIDVNTHFNEKACLQHDLESFPYPFKSEEFDLIICSEVLEHVFDPVKVTKEIHRLLKPGGIYLVSTPNLDFIDHFVTHFREIKFDTSKSWTKEHIHNYNIESHEQILQTAGFKLVEYVGADAHGGAFFQEARRVFSAYVKDNVEVSYTQFMSDTESQIITDKLLGLAFKDWMHTTIVVAKK